MVDPKRFIASLAEARHIIPPLVLELVLRDGSRYYVQAVLSYDDASKCAAVRIWDLRALNDADIEELKARLSQPEIRKELGGEGHEVHPKLDWANLRISLEDIMYCIEWHDRFWPEEERQRLGFIAS